MVKPFYWRRPGECERCNDVGDYGNRAIATAYPPVPTWPAFKVCAACADELEKPAHGENGYRITFL